MHYFIFYNFTFQEAIWRNSITKVYHSDLRCLQRNCRQIKHKLNISHAKLLCKKPEETEPALSIFQMSSEAWYKQMWAKTLTMDKNEVRLFFSIYNISKEHFISLVLEEKEHFLS